MKAQRFKSYRIAVYAFALTIFFTSVSRAGLSCVDLFKVSEDKSFQSSVEVEIGATPKVIDLFTTKDGSLWPVVGEAGERAVPEDLLKQLRDFVGAGVSPLDAPWDLLTADEKISIISKSAEVRGHNFNASRTVPGLQYREQVELEFNDFTRFLGRVYSPGKYSFASGEIFGNTKIEFMGSNRMTENLGFELHVRSSKSAGDNKLTSEALQLALIGRQQNVHIHVVAPYPNVYKKNIFQRALSRLEKIAGFQKPDFTNPIDVYRLAEFVRRTNLYFDLKMIENGIKMTTIRTSDDRGDNFFPSDRFEFMRFVRGIADRDSRKGTFSKAGSLGVRGKAYYDQDVWGIEVRYMSPRLQSAKTAKVLDFVQERMISKEYFIDQNLASRFMPQPTSLRRATIFNDKESVEKLLYSSYNFRKFKGGTPEFIEQERRKTIFDENDFVKILYHDWSNDPMFVDNQSRITQIKKAQDYCLKLIDRGQDSAEVMKIFMKKSGMSYELNGFFEGSIK